MEQYSENKDKGYFTTKMPMGFVFGIFQFSKIFKFVSTLGNMAENFFFRFNIVTFIAKINHF